MTESTKPSWHSETDAGGIVWLHLARPDSSVNTLSSAVLEEFGQHLQTLEQQTPAGLVILSDKPSGFIAGADVQEFRGLSDPDEIFKYIRFCQGLFDRLEALSCPTVALINGFCMGGGTELALACRYRIGLDDPATRIGLPEIKLGIHPGYGGTVRSTRLLGAVTAMDIMLTGRPLSAGAAVRCGLLDYKVPARHLQNAARQVIQEQPPVKKPKWWQRMLSLRALRPMLAWQLRRQVATRAFIDHYPAPYALIDLWQDFAGSERMMLEEAHSVARLIATPTAQNLIRVFFLQNLMKAAGRQSRFKARHVHVIGAGVMGGDIAAWCALQGLTVTLQDQSAERIAPAIKRAASLFSKKLKADRVVTQAMDRLIPDPDGNGVSRADVIIEAIFEDLDAKQTLFSQLEPRLQEHALLCTNTSSIPLQELGQCLNRPARLVGLHFFNPVEKMQLIEVVHAEHTDTNVIQQAAAFAAQLSKLPLQVKSTPGFLVNRVLMPYLLEAAFMVQEGIDPAIIDKAALKFGMPMGPVELSDKVGLDICLSVAEILTQHLGGQIPDILNDRVTGGQLGIKTGAGFYQYRNGKPIRRKVDGQADILTEVQDRLLLRMLNEVVICLREGIVEGEDLLDAGIIFGTGFAPFTGGPLHYLHSRKLDQLKVRFEEFRQRYGERFDMDSGWDDLLSR